MTDVLEDVDFVLLEDELPTVVRESVYERESGIPEHEAHWYATATCGDIIAICERRRAKCHDYAGWMCTTGVRSGCTLYHRYDHLEFRRI